MVGLYLLFCLSAATVQLKGGEIFEGKIVAESEDRIWLKVPSGGTLAFDKSRVAKILGKAENSLVESSSTRERGYIKERTPQEPRREKPGISPGPVSKEGKQTVVWWRKSKEDNLWEISLRLPEGFSFESFGSEGDLVGGLYEETMGVKGMLKATPSDLSIEEEALRAEKALGKKLKAHRAYLWGETEGRVLEWEATAHESGSAGFIFLTKRGGLLLRFEIQLRKTSVGIYRPILFRIFQSLKVSKVNQGAGS